jgi:hypothetical protein
MLRALDEWTVKSTNTYPGHLHQDWTVAGVMEAEKGVAPPTALRARLYLVDRHGAHIGRFIIS